MEPIISNLIVIILLVAIILLAAKSSIAHFKGEGACCGGGGKQKLVRPQRLKNIVAVKKVHIEGMMCDHCAARVHNALNSLEGVNAKVSLSKKTAIVKSDRELEEEKIKEVIADLGYAVTVMEEQK